MPDTMIRLNTPALTELNAATVQTESQLSGLTTATVVATTNAPLTLDSALASHLTVVLNSENYDALIAGVNHLPATRNAERYQFVLRPWLWWLTLSSNTRVFQNLSVSEIVEKVFKDNRFTDYCFQLKTISARREYCLQYNESDFNFISRLLEQEGIFWFFIHEEGKHTLVLADDNSAFPPISGEKTVKYQAAQSDDLETGAIRAATLHLQAAFNVKAEGDALAAWKVNALKASAKQLVGESDCAALQAGHWFTLIEHDDKALNMDWLVIAVTHEYDGEHYRNRFTAIPKATPYRPQNSTPKPFMHTQTAIVVGKQGEEIWTDNLGRIKVQFPWDREGKKDETSSCWLRIATAWSGNGFGSLFIPRIGQEVVVNFIDGDPDKPLITGCVYNSANQERAIDGNETHNVKGNCTLNVDGNLTIKVSGALTLESGKSLAVKSSADLNAIAGTSLKLDAATIACEAKSSLTQKAETISHEAKNTLRSKASTTQTLDAGGMLTIKGGLVKIN